MIVIYCIAGACAGWLLPEFLLTLAPNKGTVPIGINLMSAFVGAALVHMIYSA